MWRSMLFVAPLMLAVSGCAANDVIGGMVGVVGATAEIVTTVGGAIGSAATAAGSAQDARARAEKGRIEEKARINKPAGTAEGYRAPAPFVSRNLLWKSADEQSPAACANEWAYVGMQVRHENGKWAEVATVLGESDDCTNPTRPTAVELNYVP